MRGQGSFALPKSTSLVPGALVECGEFTVSLHRLSAVSEAQLLNIPSN